MRNDFSNSEDMINLQGTFVNITSFTLATNESGTGVSILELRDQSDKCIYLILKDDKAEKWRNLLIYGQRYKFTELIISSIYDTKTETKIRTLSTTDNSVLFPFNESVENFANISILVHNSNPSNLTSYQGIVTSTAKSKFGIYELNNDTELLLCYVLQVTDVCYPLEINDTVEINYCHVIPADGNKCKKLVCCGASFIRVKDPCGNEIRRSSYENISEAFLKIILSSCVHLQFLEWLIDALQSFERKFFSSTIYRQINRRKGPFSVFVYSDFKEILSSYPNVDQRSLLQEFTSHPYQCIPCGNSKSSLRFEAPDFTFLPNLPSLRETKDKFGKFDSNDVSELEVKFQKMLSTSVLIGVVEIGRDGCAQLKDATDSLNCLSLGCVYRYIGYLVAVKTCYFVNEMVKATSTECDRNKFYIVAETGGVIPLCRISRKMNIRKELSSGDGSHDLLTKDSSRNKNLGSTTNGNMSDSILKVTSNQSSNTLSSKQSAFFKKDSVGCQCDFVNQCSYWLSNGVASMKDAFDVKNLENADPVTSFVADIVNVKYFVRGNSSFASNKCESESVRIKLCDVRDVSFTCWISLRKVDHVRSFVRSYGVIPGNGVMLSGVHLQYHTSGCVNCKPCREFRIKVVQFRLREENTVSTENTDERPIFTRPESLHPETVKCFILAYHRLMIRRGAYIDQTCDIYSVLYIKVTAQCPACQSVYEYNKCSYVGCHSSMIPAFNYFAKCIVSDGSFKSKLHVKGKEHVRSLLKLNSNHVKVFEVIASWYGELIYDKPSIFNVRRSSSSIEAVLSYICQRPSVYTPIKLKGRPYLERRNKMKIVCTGIER